MAGRLTHSLIGAAVLPATACQEPFDVARHDLGPFRIAAVGVDDGVARAAVWSGQGMFHDERPVLEWSLDGQRLGEGFDVAVSGEGELTLQVTSPGGEVFDAVVNVAEPPPAFSVERSAAGLGADLSLDARLAVDSEPVDDTVLEGEAARLELTPDADWTAGLTTRWMSAGGQGTLLELQTFAADVLADEVVFDDGEVESRLPLGPGIYPQLALVIDGAGGNRWLWVDAAIGVSESLVRHDGRLIPVDGRPPAADLLAGTLIERDDLVGVGLSELEPALDLSDQDALPCFPTGEAFRFAWLAEGRCTRPEVLGARVVVQTW